MIRAVLGAGLIALLAGCGGDPRDVIWGAVEGVGRSACQAAQSCTNTCPDGQRFDDRARSCRPDR